MENIIKGKEVDECLTKFADYVLDKSDYTKEDFKNDVIELLQDDLHRLDNFIKDKWPKPEMTEKAIKKILNMPTWPPSLDTDKQYFIRGDDSVHNSGLGLTVIFVNDGDAHIQTTSEELGNSVRVRTLQGGGHNKRVRMALMILAIAIEMDNEDPQY